jgi:hypothetical protein
VLLAVRRYERVLPPRIQRAGRLLETEQFGPHEWYPEIANFLLTQQQADGSWAKEVWEGVPPNSKTLKEKSVPGVILETCFAVLVLRRATPKLADTIPAGGGKNQ